MTHEEILAFADGTLASIIIVFFKELIQYLIKLLKNKEKKLDEQLEKITEKKDKKTP